VIAGAAVSAVALAVTQVALPFADRWAAREAAYDASRERWTRLASLVASGPALEASLRRVRDAGRASDALLVPGTTPALAASGLQMVLRRYAEESQVQLDRVDVAGQPKPDRPGLLAIPVVLQGQGDVYGLVDFLYRLQHGERLLVIDQLTTTAALARGTDDGEQRLAWSVSAHGLYPAPEGGAR
jgi:hypothetical protein